MMFESLPTEIINQIYLSCASIGDVVALSSSCHRLRRIFASSQKLNILAHAADVQYGPLRDVTQLLTQNASQPAHVVRNVPLSIALLKQIVTTGKTAERWCDIYPFKKWKVNFEDRRLLRPEERRRIRRALYRLWLYSRAFHNGAHSREMRMQRPIVAERAALLHNWPTGELAEIADVHAVIRDVVHSNICPSNGTIARKFKKRHPEYQTASGQLLFNIHLNYPAPQCGTAPQSQYHSVPDVLANHFYNNAALAVASPAAKWRSAAFQHDPGAEGWGDDIQHYYVVEDMLKLDPGQILWLRDNAPLKGQVEAFVRALGDWFANNGDTWGQTLEWVLGERGEDAAEVLGAVADGELGITAGDD